VRDTRRSRLLLVLLVAAAFLLITLDVRSQKGIFDGLRSGVSSVAGRLEKGISTITSPITDTWSSVADSNKEKKRADHLSQQLAQANQQLAQQEDALREAGALSRLRHVADEGGYTIVPARIIATDDQLGLAWSVTVDAGSDTGVRPGMLVIDSDGLVGSTVRVGASTSVVRLACDPTSHIGARLEGSQALGKVDGDQPDRLMFTLYDAGQRLQTGDRLVTFGSADYAPGVPIGTVTRLRDGGAGLARVAEIKPFVSFGTLDLVGVVVQKPATNPGDRVLPPGPVPPSPTQSPTQSPTPGPTASLTPGPTPAQVLPLPAQSSQPVYPAQAAAPAQAGQAAARAQAGQAAQPRTGLVGR
jgi:rod shape-determining protein MreC